MAETWPKAHPMPDKSSSKLRPPLDADALERLATHYVGRYATTRARLADYLRRKLRERGWEGEGTPDLPALAARFAEAGWLDDRSWGEARSRGLVARGYGPRRVSEALGRAGVDGEDADPARALAADGAWTAALRLAERRGIGPFAAQAPDRPVRERWMAMLVRAGHDFRTARALAWAEPGEVPDDPALA